MTSYTTNQSAALGVFHNIVETSSDFGDHDFAEMKDLIYYLVSNGWDVKSAEGTIGSLLENPESGLAWHDEADGGYQIYIIRLPSDHPLYGCNDFI
jgi:hypothetical protein